MSTTIQEIADKAGVSKATVSRVINGLSVKYETAQKVKTVITKMQYRPHRFARGLSARQTGFLGIVTPPLDDPYVASVLAGMEEESERQGKLITLSVCRGPGTDEKEIIQSLTNPPLVDGLLFLLPTVSLEPQIRELSKKGFSIVVASERRFEELASAVVIDNFNGARQATEYLIGKGHKRIGFISGKPELTDSFDRLEGYSQALKDAGIPFIESLVAPGNYELSAGQAAAEKFLDMGDPPTAVFASNDRMAIGLLKTLQAKKMEGSMAVVGFDDIPMASLCSPALTTIGTDLNELGRQAVHKLMRLVKGEEKGRSTLMMKTHLVVRESA